MEFKLLNPHLVGILNITPDSFSDGGRDFKNIGKMIQKAEKMFQDGASLIDIGGESTRPGANMISPEEEQSRILPIVAALIRNGISKISIDTRNSSTAKKCIQLGASWINDISALRHDSEMINVVNDANGIVLMHMQNTVKSMQKQPQYVNVVQEIKHFLQDRVNFALSRGIKISQLYIDPGIGFGKTLEHNLIILNNLNEFKEIAPIFIGPSRKSFIGQITHVANPAKRDYGTIGALFKAAKNGATYVRIHNVKACADALKIFNA